MKVVDGIKGVDQLALIILGDPDVSKVITSFLNKEGGHRRARNSEMALWECLNQPLLGFKKNETMSPEMQKAIGAGKRKEMDFFLEPPEGTTALPTAWF